MSPTTLGWSEGQTRIEGAAGSKRSLATTSSVLPELSEAQEKPRPLWKHPAFILSMALTIIALVVSGVLIVLSLLGGSGGTVTGLTVDAGEGNAHLSWTVDSGDVDLYVVTGDEATDLTQLVRGTQAWVPSALGLFDRTSCFVVRSTDQRAQPVTLDADQLAAQNASSACVGS